ncbi:MAG: RNA methyltransferase [Chloroflexota bacterium]|nr:RNA methyltransferase [Chloroflexota bacterium]
MGEITNPQNAHVKEARFIRDRKRSRYQDRRYFIEGLRLVSHALRRGRRPVLVFYDASFVQTEEGQALVQHLTEGDSLVWRVSPEVMDSLSDTVTPQGIVAIVPMPDVSRVTIQESTLLLVLDNVRDPGNVGTILRTAEATGTDAVVLSKGCADAYDPKVVRAGMGAQLRLPLFTNATWGDIAAFVEGKQCLVADANGQATPWMIQWNQPTALIVGNEAHGASPEAWELADQSVRLPMAEDVESLNVAIATAIFLFEAQHQRGLA